MKKYMIHPLKTIGQGLPLWMRMTARLPFLFLFAADALTSGRSRRMAGPPSKCRSLSVIIPTLNEEQNIVRCIRSVSGNRCACEIIVVDAGSGDQTRKLAQEAGARVIVLAKPLDAGGGRGGQIHAGIQAACGDVAAILHADAIAQKGIFDRMIVALNRNPEIIGGSAGCRFDSPKFRFRLLELANDFRAAFLKISFGDQIQFFRRQPVVDRGLFPAIPLMEDVELSIRLHRLGKQTFLFGGALVSIRRWEKAGFHNALWVIGHVCEYLIRRLWSAPDTVALYKKYYKNK
ncbi:MAG: glycosyltransferase [Desulfobacteraceae bacterium]|nr:MAG: glycosyltransferase [Desulfobacteraceae bacterium]